MKKLLQKKFAAFIITLIMFSGTIHAQWAVNGTNISNINSGNVGVGTAAPNAKLHININTNVSNSAALGITGTNPYFYINSTSLQTSNAGKDLNIIAYSPASISFPPAPVPTPGNLLLQTLAPGVLARTGNVGIGTASPVQKLHVTGASILANNTAINPNTTARSVIAGAIQDGPGWQVVSGIGGKGLGAGSAWAIGSTSSGLFVGFSDGVADNTMYTGMQILPNRNVALVPGGIGRVGIGTTLPEGNLHVFRGSAGTVTANSNAPVVVENSTDNYINLLTPSNNESGILFGNNGNAQDGGIIYASSKQLQLRTNGNTNRMVITSIGDVGIGTNNPAYRLDVCGTARAKEIRVQTGWCDYVFADDYKLPALGDVESFIKKNRHLPNVTPGPEIENNGLEVGKVSSQMIRKIEELTLYVIELQKQVDTLKNSRDKN